MVQSGVPPGGVVETLDVLKHGGTQLGASGPGVTVNELTFEGGVKAFTDRVVKAVTDRAHRHVDAHLDAAIAEHDGGVLGGLKRSSQQFAVRGTVDEDVDVPRR